jgi:hypothetical protein
VEGGIGMRWLFLVASVAISTATAAAAHAASVQTEPSGFARNASPQADARTGYQSCSQGDQPLFSEFPPKSGADFQTYMHYTPFKNGKLNDILMWGEIDRCDERRLRQVLQSARPIGKISLISPGGALDEAMAMGRTLRDFGATVIVEQGHPCISACNFVFMGGAVRMVEPGADFEVHMFDDDAANRLQGELSDPPGDLVAFLKLFPFRSDETMDQINAEVQDRNTVYQKAASELRSINQELLRLSGTASLQGDARADGKVTPDKGQARASRAGVASSSQSSPPASASLSDDQAKANVTTMDNDCSSILYYGLTANAPLDLQRKYVSVCLDILSRPYSALDWFNDQARTEDVKAIQQDAATTAAEIARYLSGMSISLRFLTDFASIPNSKPRQLSIEELRDLNIVNAD